MQPFFRDLAVEREFETGIQSETYQIGIVGGTVAGLREDGTPNGPRTHQAVRWKEQALVIERGSYTGPTPESGVWAERHEVWSFDPDGRLRVEITERGSSDSARNTTLVYRRQ